MGHDERPLFRLRARVLALLLLAYRVVRHMMSNDVTFTEAGVAATGRWLTVRQRLVASGFGPMAASALDVGDLVMTAGGVLGVVHEITTRTVVIDTSDGRRVFVPNSDVLNDTIINYTALGRRRAHQRHLRVMNVELAVSEFVGN